MLRWLVGAFVVTAGIGATIDAAPALATSYTYQAFAGTGTIGAPQAGAATSSPLGQPFGLAVAPNGSVYVSDVTNGDIEQVSPTGTLSIFASGLNSPHEIAVDSSGDVFVVTTGNCEVIKIVPGGGTSVVAGTGTCGLPTLGAAATSSKLDGPWGVAVDFAGDLYISDTAAQCVEEVTASTGLLSAFVGH